MEINRERIFNGSSNSFKGIELRDYIAIKVMQEYIRNGCSNYDQAAKFSYEMADKMLEERAKE